MSDRLKTEILEELDDAWLNINVKNSELIRPLDLLKTDDSDEFYNRFTWLVTQPEYFSFFCKHVLNIDLLPFQALILQEMWNRKFPMLIASRGGGKATTLDTPVLTHRGWVNMGDLTLEDQIFGRDGKLYNITGIYPQGKKQVCELTFLDGRTIECCEDHLWVTERCGKEKVVNTKKIIDSGIKYPAGKGGGPNYKFRVPNCEPIQFTKKELTIDPYIMGALLGNGGLNTGTPSLSTVDDFLLQECRTKLVGFEIEFDKDTDCKYTIVDRQREDREYLSSLGNTYTKNWGNRLVRWLKELKVNVRCEKKFIPEVYKNSCYEDRMELVRGMMDTDGYINTDGSCEYTSKSECLIDDLSQVLRSLGITCTKSIDRREGKLHTIRGKEYIRGLTYRLYINTSKPIFKLPRKLSRSKSKSTSGEKYVAIINGKYKDEYKEMQCISVDSPDHTYITKDYLVTHNTFILALYALLRALFLPNRKIVVVGSVFRQSKYIHDYIENIWKNSPILRDLCDSNSGPRRDVDMCKMIINNSIVTALPIGDGQKIRGQRGHDILSDEFASMSRNIFENVIAGFAAVSASPAENVKKHARKQKALEIGDTTLIQKDNTIGNQIVIAGTAYYEFNHFSEYFKKWRSIVRTQGDPHLLANIFGEDGIPDSFNWKDYMVIRLPVDMLPKGFMDESQVARSKATIHTGIFDMEFGSCFSSDSHGFFKRSLIESCVGTKENPIPLPSGPVFFDPSLRGNPSKKYVIGVDPASEVDNFSVVITEVNPDHRRVVYVWTTNKKNHTDRLNSGITSENNFYSYCARKIRDLMILFPCARICMDSQGGGVAVREALHDDGVLLPGELPIYEIIEEDKEKDTDDKVGLHILEMCNFANYEWLSGSNHGLRHDLENHTLIFPQLDPVTVALSLEEDKSHGRLYDTLEDCVMEIEELKTELSLIEITKTATGRDKWDTPETKVGVGKKERMRKDRYSALLLSNSGAKAVMNTVVQQAYTGYGGFAEPLKDKEKVRADFSGPIWFTEACRGLY